jgi:hypothetical protein
MRAARLVAVAVGAIVAAGAPASADDVIPGSIVFARGGALLRSDTHGRNETELAKLPENAQVRALRTDAAGKILLVDLGTTWAYLPLDGSTQALADLPCAPGPASLAEDGLCVVCRAQQGAQIVNLAKGGTTPIDVPVAGARITGTGENRKLVWPASDGVWAAPPRDLASKTKVAPDAPLRGFLASPDGARALGTYSDSVYVDVRHTKQSDVLEGFALDGTAARRKAIRDGLPIEWSHDAQWVLVQDGSSACIMKVSGGQYKCWKGYTAASLSPDGKWALLFGNRDAAKSKGDKKSDKKTDKKNSKSDKKKQEPAPDAEPSESPESGDSPADIDDVALPPPTGPQSLYRAQLEGAYTTAPALVVKVVEGAAVWVP